MVIYSLHSTGESAPIMRGGGDGSSVPLGGSGTVHNQGLSHVTQISNNTGSLPSNITKIENHSRCVCFSYVLIDNLEGIFIAATNDSCKYTH